MLGYLHPQLKKSNPKIKEQYRALYCGLCHSLKKNYGYRGVACLNYEVTFLLLLIIAVSESGNEIFYGSCSVTPFIRVPFVDYLNTNVKTAANLSIIVSGFEIEDNVTDGGTFIWKIFGHLLDRLNEKATKELSEFEIQIKSKLIIFYNLEKSKDYALDEMLKACGKLVESITGPLLSSVDGPIAAIISKIANSIGQWIYLIDACDDFQKDMAVHNYNPLLDMDNYQVVREKLNEIQGYISELISMLPLNEYGDLLRYFSEECIPQRSNEIFEKYKRDWYCNGN